MENKTIKLELTVNEINLVLTALAKQPFEAVAEIINKVKSQGEKQLQETENKNLKKVAK